jgi:hypothetical protein
MATKLEGLDWKPMWVTHLGCLKGCLDYLKIDVSDAWLFGGTGHAFIITWELVKLAINAGFPCYGWELAIPEYYVVYGYDQNRYYFKGIGADHAKPRLWMELGDSDIGCLEMNAVKPLECADDATIVKDALGFALEFAQSPDKWVMDKYKAGLAGFDLWIDALKAGAAHELGMPYNAAVWHECRHLAVEFLKEARGRLDDKLGSIFDEAISHYEVIRDNLKKVVEQFPFEGRKPEHVKDSARCNKAIDALEVARDGEEAGLKSLQKIVDAL